jgi:chemotaxis protein methyltransferase CheR
MLSKTEILENFAKYIESQTGITYGSATFFQLENRLESIALQIGETGLDGLWNLVLKQGWTSPFKNLLLDLATNNETSFFRDPGVFEEIGRAHV